MCVFSPPLRTLHFSAYGFRVKRFKIAMKSTQSLVLRTMAMVIVFFAKHANADDQHYSTSKSGVIVAVGNHRTYQQIIPASLTLSTSSSSASVTPPFNQSMSRVSLITSSSPTSSTASVSSLSQSTSSSLSPRYQSSNRSSLSVRPSVSKHGLSHRTASRRGSIQPQKLRQKDIHELLDEHNKYRRTMRASNMWKLVWDEQLALDAQEKANLCRFEHSEQLGEIGENIWASPYLRRSISEAISDWYNELHDEDCSCSNVFKECCGHFTQVIWAETNRLGCGYTLCEKIRHAEGFHYILVCLYSPGGNLVMQDEKGDYVGLPAFKRRKRGDQPCSGCENSTTVCDQGLCDIR